MSKKSKSRSKKQNNVPLRAGLALGAPLLGGLLLAAIAGGLRGGVIATQTAVSQLLTGAAVVSLLLGRLWYGLPGNGLRGGRPLFSSIGFAVLGWVVYLGTRFYFVQFLGWGGSGRAFYFALIFEGFALHLWTFGFLFRALADWRGGLTAAIGSGLIFGTAASILFQEAYITGFPSWLFFVTWGIFYGVIRLRSGSFLGLSIIQAIQTFTVWGVFVAPDQPAAAALQNMYLTTSVLFLILIWRLWPKTEEDYRV